MAVRPRVRPGGWKGRCLMCRKLPRGTREKRTVLGPHPWGQKSFISAVYLLVADQAALFPDATPPGIYRPRGTSSLQQLFRAHFPQIRARYEAEFARRLGKFRLERITRAVERFLGPRAAADCGANGGSLRRLPQGRRQNPVYQSPGIEVGAAHWLAPLPPPNRTGGSPASGSPVRGYRRAD